MKKHTIGYIRKSKTGSMLNLTGKKSDLDAIQTFESKDGTVRFRFGLFPQDLEDLLSGKSEYARVVQLQDEE